METTLFEAAVRAADKANAAKDDMEIAWQTCLASHTDENEAAFFAANEAWLHSVKEWMSAANTAKEAVAKKPEQQRPAAGNILFTATVRAAEAVNAAKTAEETAWQEWLVSNTAANKATFLAARAAWLKAVRDWKLTVAAAQKAADEPAVVATV
ncbi:MAG: hypothetical protein HQL87_08525 [Magnetococcales bacterium]|nr:hypothetical protein [Magnetococcales bacterium]